MSLWLIVLICTSLPNIVFASQCANEPLIGQSAEIIATKFDDVTCGDPVGSFDCSRYIQAKIYSETGYSQVRLLGNYSLLGSVYCIVYNTGTNRCTISTIGDVTVGCCGTFQAYEYFNGDRLSSLTVGSNSAVKLAKLTVEDYSSFRTGNNTSVDDLYQSSSITVAGIMSTVTFNGGARFVLVNTAIESRDLTNILFDCIGVTVISNATWLAKISDVYIKPNNEASFRQAQLTLVSSNMVVAGVTILAWTNVNLNLNEAFIDWSSNSSVSLTLTDVTMAAKSKWIMTNSVLTLMNVKVTFGTDSYLLISNAALQASSTGVAYKITIGNNSSFVISGNTTERLKYSLIANLVIPPNVRYTEAHVSGMLTSNSAVIEDMKEESDVSELSATANGVETGDQRLDILTTHYDYCPMPTASTTTTVHSETSTVTNTRTSSIAITSVPPTIPTTTTATQTIATGTTALPTIPTLTTVPPSFPTVTTVPPTITTASTVPPTITTVATVSQTIPTVTTTAPSIPTITTVPTTIPTVTTLSQTTSTGTATAPSVITATTIAPSISTTTSVPPTVASASTVSSTFSTTTTVPPTTSVSSSVSPTIFTTTSLSSNATENCTESTSATTTTAISSSRPATSAGVHISMIGRSTFMLVFAAMIL